MALRASAERRREGVAGPDDTDRRGTGSCSTRGGPDLAEEVLGHGADVYVEEPAALRDEVVGRLTRGRGSRRVTDGGPGGARDQVARLLTLVPFLHIRGQVRLDDAAAALGMTPAQVLGATSRCCSCAGCRAAIPTT